MSVNVTDILFILQFVAAFYILAVLLFNIFSGGVWIEVRQYTLYFIGYFIVLVIGLFCVLVEPETLIYSVLFKLEAGFTSLNIIFYFVNLALYYNGKLLSGKRSAYKRE